MTLEEFAKSAGVTICSCEKEWGGTVAYKCKDYPNTTFCGFRTEKAALNNWMESTFGKRAAKALKKLLTQTPQA